MLLSSGTERAADFPRSYGAMEITLPAHNTKDTSNPYVFLKEISSNGDVNTVDVIYPASTILGVLSPVWIKYLLEPIASFCETPEWTVDYVVHDLGSKPDSEISLAVTADLRSFSLSQRTRTYHQQLRAYVSTKHRRLSHNGVPIPATDQGCNLGPIARKTLPRIRLLPP